MEPYYEDDWATIYHGDAQQVTRWLCADVLLTDPPYGIDYHSGSRRREGNARSIHGDVDTTLRDSVIDSWFQRANWSTALVFGSPRVAKPARGLTGTLVWDKGGALGMGDLSVPWKFNHEEIYVLGGPWVGRRDSGSVVHCPPVQSVGRAHPHEKPVPLLTGLLAKCPFGTVADPFMGSGSTLRAAKNLCRKAIGIEIEERYCEIAAERLSQEVLDFGGSA